MFGKIVYVRVSSSFCISANPGVINKFPDGHDIWYFVLTFIRVRQNIVMQILYNGGILDD